MNRIRQLRKTRGVGQLELAARLNVSQGTLSNWENRHRESWGNGRIFRRDDDVHTRARGHHGACDRLCAVIADQLGFSLTELVSGLTDENALIPDSLTLHDLMLISKFAHADIVTWRIICKILDIQLND